MAELAPASARLDRDAAAVITRVDPGITALLGWEPKQLVGHPSTDFIHPEDQPSAVAAWFEMLAAGGEARSWRGRYRSADGTWKWVETLNRNRLDDPGAQMVETVMTLVTVDEVSIEEQLRARKQQLSRLAGALPVGVFQIDGTRQITFTNDRFHAIAGRRAAATLDAQFAGLAPHDAALFDDAVARVFSDQAVDDVELRMDDRACVLAMRPLTDRDGAVNGAIGCLTDVTESVRLRHEMEHRAATDELTGCLNRAATLALVERVLAEARDGIAVAYVDLNRFKRVNDEHGHAAGDRVLEAAARRLRMAARQGDAIGRLGGDEFLVVSRGVEGPAAAAEIGRRLTHAVTGQVRLRGAVIPLTASVGVAWTAGGLTADELVAQADRAMYASKRAAAG